MIRQPLLAGIAIVAVVGLLSPDARPADAFVAQSTQPRLVVFEFFDSTCPSCVAAGVVVESLAQQYAEADRPVVFIEYRSSDYMGNRLDRWYDAIPNPSLCYLPLELVDSGWRVSCDEKDYRSVYTEFVDQALANPAGADLTAYYERSGRTLDVHLAVTNHSGTALGPINNATANVIVYEQLKVLNTGRFARAAAELPLSTVLPDGAKGSYQLQLTNVPVFDWARAVVVALLDYRPNPVSSGYESLQAAIAIEGPPPTATPVPSPTEPPTPTRPTTPTATPVWTGEPLFLPVAF